MSTGEPDAGTIIDVAWALLEDGEPREARRALEELLEEPGLDPLEEADARHVLGLALEELGDQALMVREWLRVLRLDEATDPRRPMMSRQRFIKLAERALAELPPPILAHLGNVAVLADDRPTAAMVRDGIDPRLLGLFSGVAMPDQSSFGGAPFPEVIHLFQRNLEAEADSEEELAEQIRITVLHETAHYFGFDDDQLTRLGLG
jgi:predicted Zn-dependent protease with MMP-like domain